VTYQDASLRAPGPCDCDTVSDACDELSQPLHERRRRAVPQHQREPQQLGWPPVLGHSLQRGEASATRMGDRGTLDAVSLPAPRLPVRS